MGKVLLGIAGIWLLVVIIAPAFFRISRVVMLPNGTSQRQAHFMLFAAIVILRFGWLIPLSAGLGMIRRR